MDTFHATWRQFFTPLIFSKASFLDYSTTPRFSFVEETTGEVAGRVWPSVLGLVVPAATIAGLALRRLVRFPVVA